MRGDLRPMRQPRRPAWRRCRGLMSIAHFEEALSRRAGKPPVSTPWSGAWTELVWPFLHPFGTTRLRMEAVAERARGKPEWPPIRARLSQPADQACTEVTHSAYAGASGLATTPASLAGRVQMRLTCTAPWFSSSWLVPSPAAGPAAGCGLERRRSHRRRTHRGRPRWTRVWPIHLYEGQPRGEDRFL